MKIQDALKPTGKVRKGNNKAEYATLISIDDEDTDFTREYLAWESDAGDLVHYTDIMEDDWEPYYEEKEDVPEVLEEPFIEVEGVKFSFDVNACKVYFTDYDKIKATSILHKTFKMKLYLQKG